MKERKLFPTNKVCDFPRFGLALILVAGLAAAAAGQVAPPAKCPPPARTDNITDTYGSTVVADPYQWLEDQKSPETRAWIDAEDACTNAALSRIPGRDAIAKRLADLYHNDQYSVPIERAGRYFFTKRAADQDLSLIYMRRGRTGRDEVLVDPLSWSKDHSVSASLEAVSRDGTLVFYGRREGGQDEVTVHVLDLKTGRDLPDVLSLRHLLRRDADAGRSRSLLRKDDAGRAARVLPRDGNGCGPRSNDFREGPRQGQDSRR